MDPFRSAAKPCTTIGRPAGSRSESKLSTAGASSGVSHTLVKAGNPEQPPRSRQHLLDARRELLGIHEKPLMLRQLILSGQRRLSHERSVPIAIATTNEEVVPIR